MREDHRADAERLLVRAVEEEARRPGAHVDQRVLLSRARGALEALAEPAAEEYAAYLRALDEAEAGRLTFRRRFAQGKPSTPLAVTAATALTACVADLAAGTGTGTALGVGAVVALVGAAATVARVTAAHLPAASRQAAALHQPGGAEQLRLQWLTALEVRCIRPFLDQQRMLAAASGSAQRAAPRLRRTDKSAAARRRTVLQQSLARLPRASGPFTGRRQELAQIAQWVHAARAAPGTRPVVVLLHGEPGSGRSTLAVRAADALKDQFRGACVVDLRGAGPDTAPLSTRDALLHLLNRLGAPREQLLFRDRPSQEQQGNQVRRLAELYQRHLTGLPVVLLLDDASDAAQIGPLVPEHSESLVLVTTREAFPLPGDLHARVHRLHVPPLDAAGAEELLRASAADDPGPYDAEAAERVSELCGGLPLALRIAGSSLGPRTARQLADELGAYGPVGPVERALWLRYTEQPEGGRRLLRRLALAGRASLGAAAAAALLATDESTAGEQLSALAAASLLDRVRGSRYRLHTAVRAFARDRLRDEETTAERTAAQQRLIVNYAELADSVIRLVDGRTSTRADAAFHADAMGPHGFASLEAALRWLDDESSFITAALRHAEGVDEAAVLHLLGALCDYCLLRGDLYRLGEISELTQSVDRGLLGRSVQWRTGIAARQVGELDTSRTTLASVVDLYFEAHHEAGAARALGSLGITLHHQGNLTGAEEKLREALALQAPQALAGDRGWTLHALAAVLRDLGRPREALDLLTGALELHRASESVHGLAWTHFQLGQTLLRLGDVPRAETELREALELYGRTRDPRGEAWALTQLARARLVAGDAGAAVEGLRQAAAAHRDNEDARGAAWSTYYLGQALEDAGDLDPAVRDLERSRTMFSRMRDVYGLACARHHSARATRDQRAAQTGSLLNSGFARQLLVDARADFRRIGVAHGEAWTCLELAVVEAGNARTPQALALCGEAAELFASYGDLRGGDWARFLRCTLLPYASPGGVEIGTAVAQEELALLDRAPHPARDPSLEDCVQAYAVLLDRGVDLAAGWQAWRLRMVPGRQARQVMGVRADDGG
ncbi:hypothetical protein GCM10018793_25630 [Streptomyces sulfonofaciens]|uniref:AAA+ ATPase domain-containing protein n=1 Tax=Streptomyces sulfonofaciens TaxID=68272 RepID=A0A919KYN5_9ACTN|nr:tetratricopeptide repeat protein [Streptomyces sulfonofaciens]GHH77472.1 hypothetical protein GCM10018793_25630 [Streptomyces sulfonofaciens]